MDSRKIWTKILEVIRNEISAANFRTWFQSAEIKDISNGKIIISTPSAWIHDQLKIRYLPLIQKAATEVLNEEVVIEFIVDATKAAKTQEKHTEEDLFTIPQHTPTNIINPKFTLDNFVVGLSNNVAFAAAQAVAQNPGAVYNPLFFYGGTGVGKTHLMLGIGNKILTKNPEAKIIYCSSEKFMNDYVEAIKTNRSGELRNRYRSVDLLLVDDIQFFSGREGTQEEFFHTFNELQGKNSQVVLTSDRPPNEIAKLEDRLKSRFIGGLMIDIQPPDFDTRVAILKAKCEEKGEVIPEDALTLLASTLETNIREMEGKLIQIIQSLKAQNLPYTIESISKFINPSPTKAPILDQKKLLGLICHYFNLNLKDLTGPKRQKELVLPRHIAMYLLCEEISLTVESVGRLLGGRDHTTVMHGRDRIKKLAGTDREVQKMLIEIKQQAIAI